MEATPPPANELAKVGGPAVVEVFSSTARAWFVALVVDSENGILTVRFFDAEGRTREKKAFQEDPRLAALGTHVGHTPPPGCEVVPSSTRHGQVAYLDRAVRQKYASLQLAWQAYLQRRLFEAAKTEVPQPVLRRASDAAIPLTAGASPWPAPTSRVALAPKPTAGLASGGFPVTPVRSRNCSEDDAGFMASVLGAGYAPTVRQYMHVPTEEQTLPPGSPFGGQPLNTLCKPQQMHSHAAIQRSVSGAYWWQEHPQK